MKPESVAITISPISINDKKIVLEGLLTIRNAATIKKKLSATLDGSRNVRVIFKNVAKIDITVLQLMIALQKSAAVQDKSLAYESEFTDNIHSVLHNSGLQNIFLQQ